MKNIVSFSGGKDSTAMLLMMLEKGMQVDEIIFLDTGLEFPEMYDHIKKVEEYTGLEITKLESDKSFEYLMLEHIKRNGTVGYAFPTFQNRWCTTLLKQNVISKYLRQYDEVTEYHGIAADEPKRIKINPKRNIKYPLVEYGITEDQALAYCKNNGFDWGGLYEDFKRVSCWCCPLQSLADLKVLYNKYPEKWAQLKRWENQTYNNLRNDYTLGELELRFKIGNEFLQQYEIPDNPKLRKAIISDLRKVIK